MGIGTRLKMVVAVGEGARMLLVGQTRDKASGEFAVPHPGYRWQGGGGLWAVELACHTRVLREGMEWAAEGQAAHRLSQMVLVKKRRYW